LKISEDSKKKKTLPDLVSEDISGVKFKETAYKGVSIDGPRLWTLFCPLLIVQDSRLVTEVLLFLFLVDKRHGHGLYSTWNRELRKMIHGFPGLQRL
jgi:hypothetical protein